MSRLVAGWKDCLRERWVQPLIAAAAFNLDFLCIHPFRDGNGRASRLLLLLQCYHLGFEVGRYISLERLIEQNKDRYYETLAQIPRRWHEGWHDPWPYIGYLLYILKS
ncbi:MAG: Fic family protein, partial [Sulfuricaulis sp.]|nr:Fic family protein [Sulfuricaulis sp.]